MSQLLTVTRIPEEKFRRFSRFPYVAATKIDERYNNLYTLSGNQKQNKKSKIKILNNSCPKTRGREVIFDLREKADTISEMFGTRHKVRMSPEEQIVVQQIHVIDPVSNEEKLIIEPVKVDQKENSFAKLKERYLVEGRDKEMKFANLKEEELKKFDKVNHGMNDFSLISYEGPIAAKSLNGHSYHSFPVSGADTLKWRETADTCCRENLLNNADKDKTKYGMECARSQEDKINTSRLYTSNHSTLDLIDLGHPVPKSEEKIEHAKTKPFWLVRNTRFGGDTKMTAYRPGTTMDTFRNERLKVINENPADDLDLEEGHRIWADVNAIINNSKNKHKRMNQCLNKKDVREPSTHFTSAVSMDTDQAFNKTSHLDYAIKSRPNLGSKNECTSGSTRDRIWPAKSEMVKNLTKDKNRITGNKNIVENDAWNESVTLDRLKRFKHENFFAEKDNSSSNHDIKLTFKEFAKSNAGSNVVLDANDETTHDRIVDCNALHDMRSGAGKILLIYQSSGQCNTGHVIHLPTEGACSGKGVTMTTTLPRITPMCTPLPTGVTQPPPRSHSSASMYVPYPPKELSSSFDYLRIPGRINPLAPPPPRKRINWSWETTDQHHENEKRRLLMQKREHTRYHSAWSKAFYGAPAEKEAYRRHYREVLKQQMADKNTMDKIEFKEKIRETEQAISYDRECRMNDSQEYHRKHAYLMQYRDGNKKQMEDRWANTRYSRQLENSVDRERLRYNPINWSCSLK